MRVVPTSPRVGALNAPLSPLSPNRASPTRGSSFRGALQQQQVSTGACFTKANLVFQVMQLLNACSVN